MASGRKILVGAGSGALKGAAAGAEFGPLGMAIGGIGGGVLGGFGAGADEEAAEEERQRYEREMRLKEMESNFGHLMGLRNLKSEEAARGMSGLGMLAANRASAEQNARRRALRNMLLSA